MEIETKLRGVTVVAASEEDTGVLCQSRDFESIGELYTFIQERGRQGIQHTYDDLTITATWADYSGAFATREHKLECLFSH